MAREGDRVGRYVLDRLLGEGGMGQVWDASLHGLHGFRRRVALKIVPAERVDDDRRQLLISEARVGALLHHPNICSTMELGHDQGHWFIAMELVEGPTLRSMGRQGLLSPRGVLEAMVQTCRGLEHIHANRLVHRDIKGTNLVVDRYGTVKIVDLGVARIMGRTQGVGGTPGYMPPEQITGREGPAADVFACGATTFRLLTGIRPFGRPDEALEVVRDLDRAVAALDLDARLAPLPGLAPWVRRCFDVDPTRRPTPGELASAFRDLLPRASGLSLEEAAVEARALPSPRSTLSRTAEPRPRGHLPTPHTPMVGRADVQRRVKEALVTGRLVTLTALGGMGKTRLALAVAARLEPTFAGGAWFVDLSGIRRPDAVLAALGEVLGGLDGDDLEAALDLPRLLVLDNVEQLPGAGGDVIGPLVRRHPTLRVLVTSRVPLGLDEETVLRLEPLSPTAAVELLVQRNPTLERADPAGLHALVDLLEGSPLALELAAAQTRTLALDEVLERLRTGFDTLDVPTRQAPLRHRSLRAALHGSWALLDPGEARTLARLTVFEGSFGLEAAEAIVGSDGAWVGDHLAFLLECSLLQADASGRLRILPSTAAFAAERLSRSERIAARERHLAWFAQYGRPDALAALERRGGFPRLQAMASQVDDLLAAGRTARRLNDIDRWVDCVLAATAVFALRGPHGPAIDRLETLVQAGLPPEHATRVHRWLARLDFLVGKTADGARNAALALNAARKVPTPQRIAAALLLVADGQLHRNELALALRPYRQARALASRCDDPLVGARALHGLATLHHRRGHPDQARELYREALARFDARAAEHVRGAALLEVATHLIEVGDLEHANQILVRAGRSAERTGDRRVNLRVLGARALIDDYRGELERAAQTYAQAVQESRRYGMRRTEASNLLNLGSVHVVRGETWAAREALASARRVLARSGNPEDLDSIVLYWMGWSALDRGLHDEARMLLETVRDRKARSGEPRWHAHAVLLLARMSAADRDIATFSGLLAEAGPLVQASDDPALSLALTSQRAREALLLGDAREALALVQRARAHPAVEDQPWLLGKVALDQAELALDAKEPEEGGLAARVAVRASHRAGYRVQEACAHAIVARTSLQLGDETTARRARQRASLPLAELRPAADARLVRLLA